MSGKNYNKIYFAGVGFVFCLLFLFPSAAAGQSITAEEILQLVNNERLRQNLNPLAANETLNTVARRRANDLSEKNYFSHQSPDGSMPWDIALQENYNYQLIGENLAIDWQSTADTVTAWMASTAHRHNILNNNFHETGVAVANSGDNTLIVQIFGNRLSSDTNTEQQVINEIPIENATTFNESETAQNNIDYKENASLTIITDLEDTENNYRAAQMSINIKPEQTVLGASSMILQTNSLPPKNLENNLWPFITTIIYFPFMIFLQIYLIPVEPHDFMGHHVG